MVFAGIRFESAVRDAGTTVHGGIRGQHFCPTAAVGAVLPGNRTMPRRRSSPPRRIPRPWCVRLAQRVVVGVVAGEPLEAVGVKSWLQMAGVCLYSLFRSATRRCTLACSCQFRQSQSMELS